MAPPAAPIQPLLDLPAVTPARINEIVREERGITTDTALRLARFFGGDAQSCMNLQVAHDLRVAEMELGKRIAQEVTPHESVAVGDNA